MTPVFLSAAWSWFKNNLPVVVILICLAFINGLVWSLDNQVDDLKLSNAALEARLHDANNQLQGLEDKRKALESSLSEAQAEAAKVRVVTQTKVKKILVAAPPATCEDARKYLIEASKTPR